MDGETYFWMGPRGAPRGHIVQPGDIRFYDRFASRPLLVSNATRVQRHEHGPIQTDAPISVPDANHVGIVLLETTLEMVRSNEFPELPSRFNCMFLWEQLGWARDYHNGAPYADLYEVRAFGVGSRFRGDYGLITYYELPDTLEKMRARARRYWSGEMHGKFETLVQGKIEILRRVT